MASRYIVFDTETPNSRNNRMSAIGISVVEDGVITREFATLVNPEAHFDPFNIQLTGITPEAVEAAPTFPALWQELEPLFDSGMLVAHNAPFDMGCWPNVWMPTASAGIAGRGMCARCALPGRRCLECPITS